MEKMSDAFIRDTKQGLKCISGLCKLENWIRNDTDKCSNCIIGYNKKKQEPCTRLVCEYAGDYLRELGAEDSELLSVLDCLAHKNHKEATWCYAVYREKECKPCKYGPWDFMNPCYKRATKDALELIEKIEKEKAAQS